MRISLFCLSLALLFASSLLAGERSEDQRKYGADMAEGIQLLRSGSRDDIIRAIAKFKAALKIYRESAEAYYWIALAYSDQGNYIRAADNAKDATIYDDKMANAWLLWGQVLLYQKEWTKALEKLETAYRLAPEDPLILFNLGRVHYHGFNNPDAALPKFRSIWQKGQVIRREKPALWPLVIQARLYMGYSEFARERWDNAINSFLDVLNEDPGNYEAMLHLALAYRHNGRLVDAEKNLQNTINLLSKDNRQSEINRQRLLAESHIQLAHLYLTSGFRNRVLALTHLRIFIDLKPEGHPLLLMAQEYLRENEFKSQE